MKVIIAGIRKFKDYNFVKEKCDEYLPKQTTTILCGKALGVDTLGEKYALQNNLDIDPFPAPWDDIDGKPDHQIGINKFGKKYWKLAGFHRNQQMINRADMLIAFWDYKSSGTKDVIERARKKGIPVAIINIIEFFDEESE